MNGRPTQLQKPNSQPATGILLVSMVPPGYEEKVRAVFQQLAAIPGCYAEFVGMPLDRMMNGFIMKARCEEYAIVGSSHLANRYGQMIEQAMREKATDAPLPAA